LTLDATTFGLPPMPWDEFFGNWHTLLSMGDRMFVAARGAGSLVLDPGGARPTPFPADGLGDALVRAMSYCITGWQLAGHSVPPDLMPILQAAAVQAPAEVSTPAPAQTQGLPAAPVSPAWPGYAPIRSSPSARRIPVRAAPAAAADASAPRRRASDGALPGRVVFGPRPRAGGRSRWRRARGLRAELVGRRVSGRVMGRAYCGAANCRIDVFMSARGYATPSSLLGVAADVVLDGQGRIGLLLSATASVCAGGVCDTPFYWNGTICRNRTDRTMSILTTHVGSLPRTQKVVDFIFARERGRTMTRPISTPRWLRP
jgi:hypothetical protein